MIQLLKHITHSFFSPTNVAEELLKNKTSATWIDILVCTAFVGILSFGLFLASTPFLVGVLTSVPYLILKPAIATMMVSLISFVVIALLTYLLASQWGGDKQRMRESFYLVGIASIVFYIVAIVVAFMIPLTYSFVPASIIEILFTTPPLAGIIWFAAVYSKFISKIHGISEQRVAIIFIVILVIVHLVGSLFS